MVVANALTTILILCVIPALAYSWWFCTKEMKREPGRWRNRITLASLALVSLAILLWPVMAAFIPRNEQLWQYAEAWQRVILRICTAALILSLAGRPRLILPIVVACLGTTLFWLVSTAP